jgi:hypothetical protein
MRGATFLSRRIFLSFDVFFATEWMALWMRANRWIGFAQKLVG